MWCLMRYLPQLIGAYVPEEDEKWVLFLSLMDIMDIIFAPVINEQYSHYLQSLIKDHLTKFTELYPDSSVTPKMHYLVHYPRIMLR